MLGGRPILLGRKPFGPQADIAGFRHTHTKKKKTGIARNALEQNMNEGIHSTALN
jgi:hypothetical protein